MRSLLALLAVVSVGECVLLNDDEHSCACSKRQILLNITLKINHQTKKTLTKSNNQQIYFVLLFDLDRFRFSLSRHICATPNFVRTDAGSWSRNDFKCSWSLSPDGTAIDFEMSGKTSKDGEWVVSGPRHAEI